MADMEEQDKRKKRIVNDSQSAFYLKSLKRGRNYFTENL